jgi:putative ABC transport system substrate-binding protein
MERGERGGRNMKKRWIAMLTAATLMATSFTACGSSSGKTEYKVGVIQLVQHEALDAATQGFEDALKDKLGDSVEIEVQNAAGDSATCATIANTFASKNVDLIMANATASLQAAVASTGTIPILGTSVTDYATALEMDDWEGTTGINVSGTSDLAPLDQQADMLEELFPADSYSKVGIIYCTAEPNSKYQADNISEYLEDKGYTVTEYTFSDSNDIASVTQTACDNSDVLYIPTDNTAASCTETINSVATAAAMPIVTGEAGICKGCGVATLSIDYYQLGYRTGEMAYEVLVNGADPAEMEVETAETVTKQYNAKICEQLGITIPADYEALEEE